MTTTKTETKGRVSGTDEAALERKALETAYEIHTLAQLIGGEITMFRGGFQPETAWTPPLATMSPPTWPGPPAYAWCDGTACVSIRV